ncbi:MAG: class I SAM-dependent methyltransferase [Planctomycetaceae bacterium]
MSDHAAANREACIDDTGWHPPSAGLRLVDGFWEPATARPISYPADGNDACHRVEDESYWFAHRNACILEVLRLHPPPGVVYDIGGGNGFVALALERAGHRTVLVEPGPGARNAKARGVARVVHATLEDAGFEDGSLDAAGAFDVVEHVEHDDAFVAVIRRLLRPGGRFYGTVPALRGLWSAADVRAGHFRRYSRASLAALLRRGGLEVEFMSPIFSWLVLPIVLRRTLPSLAGGRAGPAVLEDDHELPALLAPAVRRCHAWEAGRLARRSALPFGTSLVWVAIRPPD